MKRKKSTALFLALLMIASVFLNATSVFAENEQDVQELNQPVKRVEDVKVEDKKDNPEEVKAEEEKKDSEKTEANGELNKNDGFEISEEEVPEAVGEPALEKTFTVTKRAFGNERDPEVNVGDYDTFYAAVEACKQNDIQNLYIITMNRDYTIPKTESFWHKSQVHMLLRSKEGQQFTLKREVHDDPSILNNRIVIRLQGNDTTLETQSITLDGNGVAQFTSATNQAELTLGSGTVVQNFVNVDGWSGPAIYLSRQSKLTVKDGATIQNNKSDLSANVDDSGGAIEALNSTINIEGGIFKNNTSNYYGGVILFSGIANISGGTFTGNEAPNGGVIAALGTLNITGGTFENNEAKKTSGAIIIGKNSTASISNATFKSNKASTGGAIYSLNSLNISNTTFESNQANWGGAEIKKTNFIENTADINGGAIYIKKGKSNITGCEFTKNGSQAIFIAHDSNSTTTISDTKFTENYSTSFGGGIYLGINSKLDITKSTFTKNESPYGAGIASAGTGKVNKELTNIKVDSSTFTDNLSFMGAGIFTAFPTEINKCTFTKNKADVHPQDDKTNPHDSGVGGAIEVMDNKTLIKASTFEENYAYGSGGAIGINGIARDKSKNIASIKPNISVEISDGTKFVGNTCGVGQGGAIFTIPYLYDIEGYETGVPKDTLKEKAYSNLTTAADTVFKDNVALSGYVDPPEKYADYTKLEFARNSFTEKLPNQIVAKSLLNNYDVNYKNKKLSAFFDPNDGEFKDGENLKDIRVVKGEKDKEITLLDAPKRDGYKFTGWKCSMNIPNEILKGLPEELLGNLNEGKIFKAGDKFKLDADYTFVAQWEEEKPEVKPEPKPDPQPQVKETRKGARFNFDSQELNKEGSHIAYIFGYPDNTVRPEGNITRAEAVTMLVRLKGYPIIEGQDTYKDVSKDEWYAPYIEAAFRQGILEEKEGESFRPDEKITRGELAQLISHIDKKNDAKAPFKDIEGYKYKDAIDQNYGNERILGYPDNTFKPNAQITRAETAAMLNRLFERSVKEEGLKNVEIHEFKDLKDKTYWAYYEIIEASHTHTYVRMRPNAVEELWKTIIK